MAVIDPGAQPEQTQPAEPVIDWESRYKEGQAWNTRLAQEKAELEQEAQIARALRSEDEAERRRALEQVGLAYADQPAEDPGQVYNEPDPQLLSRLDKLEQHYQQTTQQEEAAKNEQAYRELVAPELDQMGVPQALRDVIADTALNLPAVQTPQGPRPDLKGAYDQLVALAESFGEIPALQERYAKLPAVQTAVKKGWAAGKPRAAVTTQAGTAGVEAPDPLDGEARRQRILDRYEANRQ